jgi:hypothetical protein
MVAFEERKTLPCVWFRRWFGDINRHLLSTAEECEPEEIEDEEEESDKDG